MAYVTCYYCKKKINKNIAVGIKEGKKTKNYCPEHVGMKPLKDQMYDLINEVFGRIVLNTALYKEMDQILQVHSCEKVIKYIKDNKDYLEQCMYKEFMNEFAQIRYFAAILKNSLNDFVIKKPEPVIKKEIEIDMDISTNRYKTKKKRTGLDSLLEDLLDE